MNLKDLLLSASSQRSILAGAPEMMALDDRSAITRTRGGKGKPNTRLIDYNRTGPFYQQTGISNIAGNILPRLKKFWRHRFLHATKGWREYHGGAVYHLPSAVAGPQGWQLFKRSTWRPNRSERALGLVPRLGTVQQAPGIEYKAGTPVQLRQYIGKRGTRVQFTPLAAAA